VVDPVASKLLNSRMEQDFSLEADSHLTAQIILQLRRYLKAVYCSEDLRSIQGVPTEVYRVSLQDFLEFYILMFVATLFYSLQKSTN